MSDQIDINVRDADIEDRDKCIAELEKENNRLREALRATIGQLHNETVSIGSRIDNASHIAKQALEGENET